MSKATLRIEGFAGEPKQRTSQNGKHLLDISVAHTPRRKNRQTGDWEDVTDQNGQKVTLWVRGTFFDEMADLLAAQVSKGMLIELEGEPRVNAYTSNNGSPQASLELQFPTLRIVPRVARQGQSGGFGGSQGEPASPQGGNSAHGAAGNFDDTFGPDAAPF